MNHSNKSNGYHAGYVKDDFGCVKRPCECAGFAVKDKTIIGMDFSSFNFKLGLRYIEIHIIWLLLSSRIINNFYP